MAFIDFKTTIENNIPKKYLQPRRSQIYVGFQCHQNCSFCYYRTRNNESMFQRDYVLKQIDLLLAYGIHDIEITGGEPSECKDLAFYCQYIKQKSPITKIAIITNGGLYNFDAWELIDEVLVSYHASKKFNDISIFPHGNTFDKVYQTIEKARLLNKLIRTNTIIAKFNINDIENITDDLINIFKPRIINFLPINLFDDASSMAMQIDYNIVRPIIKQQINKIKYFLPTSNIFIRYMPFCDMQGYEQHILGTWQHMYDWFDWNPELCGTYLLDYLNTYKTIDQILNYLGPYGSRSIERSADCVKEYYRKNIKCLTCKYNVICDGIESTVDNIDKQIVPLRGKPIKNILEFVQDSIEKIYQNVYS